MIDDKTAKDVPASGTPHVVESDFEKEVRLQKEDWAKAEKEEKAAIDKMAALPTPFHDVGGYVGIGPLAYETKRGFIKVLSGDVVIHFEYPIEGSDPVVTEQETVVLSLKAYEAIQAAALPPADDVPMGVAARAARITSKRHEADNPKPFVKPPIVAKPGAKPTQLPA